MSMIKTFSCDCNPNFVYACERTFEGHRSSKRHRLFAAEKLAKELRLDCQNHLQINAQLTAQSKVQLREMEDELDEATENVLLLRKDCDSEKDKVAHLSKQLEFTQMGLVNSEAKRELLQNHTLRMIQRARQREEIIKQLRTQVKEGVGMQESRHLHHLRMSAVIHEIKSGQERLVMEAEIAACKQQLKNASLSFRISEKRLNFSQTLQKGYKRQIYQLQQENKILNGQLEKSKEELDHQSVRNTQLKKYLDNMQKVQATAERLSAVEVLRANERIREMENGVAEHRIKMKLLCKEIRFLKSPTRRWFSFFYNR